MRNGYTNSFDHTKQSPHYDT